jgi:hypothetical protein
MIVQPFGFNLKKESGGGGGGAITYKNSFVENFPDASATTFTTTGTLNIASGDFVVVLVAYYSFDETLPDAESIGGQALTLAHSSYVAGEKYRIRLLYKSNCSANSAATFVIDTSTANNAINFVGVAAACYSGIAASSAFDTAACNDATCTALATSSTSRTTQNITTANANSLIVCAGIDWDGNKTHTAANSFNKRLNGTTPFMFDKIVSSTGSYPGGNFSTTNTADQYLAITAAFKGA